MSDLIQIKKILEKYNKTPKKSLGQNFLINPDISKKIAEINFSGRGGAIEIGPGAGALTRELCRLYKKVAAIELDRSFEPILGEVLDGFDNVEIIFGDILETDLQALIEREFAGCEKIHVCANLPYYITTPVMQKLAKSKIDAITVMVQKEAADKLCSTAGEKHYNAAAAMVSYYGKAKKMFNIPKTDFYPMPNVRSTLVGIAPHATPIASPTSEDLMYKVIEAAFGQRRKTLVNALSSGLGADKAKIADIVRLVAGDCNIRGEELDIKAFSDISDMILKNI
jgi:16S rRNA (adenine1518-N6/adenine1519-N6)-dimethyltransferase